MIPPCAKAEGHTWEVVARCTGCGFLVRVYPGYTTPTIGGWRLFSYPPMLRRHPFLAMATTLLVLALAVPAAGQAHASDPKVGVVVTGDVGKVYSVPEGRYVFASMPGAELSSGPITVSGLLVITRATVIEADMALTYARTRGRWTITTSINHSKFFGLSYDWNWSTGIRVRVK